MATLQVRDIDDRLYESIRNLAASEKRSISQEVILQRLKRQFFEIWKSE